MNKLFTIVFLFTSLISFGQTARVSKLEKEESDKVFKLHQASIDANKAVKDYDEYISKKYGFSEIEYSTDYQFIVPKTSVWCAGQFCSGITTLSNSCLTVLPANFFISSSPLGVMN